MDPRIALAARIAAIAPFHVMEVQTAARAIEASGRTVIHMEIGEPDFPAPGPVLDAAHAALAHGGIYYTSALGLPALREAIAAHYAGIYGVDVAPERVIVTAGSSAALLLVMALLVDRDDEILLADPGYPCNRHFVRVLEGRPVGVPVGPEHALSARLRDRSRTTGRRERAACSSPRRRTRPERWSAGTSSRSIVDVVARRGAHLIVDEIYLGLSYDGARALRARAFATSCSSSRASRSTSA